MGVVVLKPRTRKVTSLFLYENTKRVIAAHKLVKTSDCFLKEVRLIT
jgi:hypothetical protein